MAAKDCYSSIPTPRFSTSLLQKICALITFGCILHNSGVCKCVFALTLQRYSCTFKISYCLTLLVMHARELNWFKLFFYDFRQTKTTSTSINIHSSTDRNTRITTYRRGCWCDLPSVRYGWPMFELPVVLVTVSYMDANWTLTVCIRCCMFPVSELQAIFYYEVGYNFIYKLTNVLQVTMIGN